jgi:hypothetical protein
MPVALVFGCVGKSGCDSDDDLVLGRRCSSLGVQALPSASRILSSQTLENAVLGWPRAEGEPFDEKGSRWIRRTMQ